MVEFALENVRTLYLCFILASSLLDREQWWEIKIYVHSFLPVPVSPNYVCRNMLHGLVDALFAHKLPRWRHFKVSVSFVDDDGGFES